MVPEYIKIHIKLPESIDQSPGIWYNRAFIPRTGENTKNS